MSALYPLAAISDWVGVAGLAVALTGVGFVLAQLKSNLAVARAQATIQFQAAFHKSRPARIRLQNEFPVHADVLAKLAEPGTEGNFHTWRSIDELSQNQKEDAEAVINAINDVAQYVVDGLPLRSALQQYHTIFVRTGVLLCPYLDQRNAPREGKPQARYGYRTIDLYNAALAYHRTHPKHRGRELALTRPSANGEGPVRLLLLGANGEGAEAHPGFPDDPETLSPPDLNEMERAVKGAERKLRR